MKDLYDAHHDEGAPRMVTARRLRTTVFHGQLWAALVVPLCLVIGAAAAGGGLLMAGFVVAAIPVAGLFALAPVLGTWVGRMRTADDVPLPYAVVTVALWVAAIPVGFLVTYTQPVPSYATVPPGPLVAEAASAGLTGDRLSSIPDGLLLVATVLLWSVVIDAVAYRWPEVGVI